MLSIVDSGYKTLRLKYAEIKKMFMQNIGTEQRNQMYFSCQFLIVVCTFTLNAQPSIYVLRHLVATLSCRYHNGTLK